MVQDLEMHQRPIVAGSLSAKLAPARVELGMLMILACVALGLSIAAVVDDHWILGGGYRAGHQNVYQCSDKQDDAKGDETQPFEPDNRDRFCKAFSGFTATQIFATVTCELAAGLLFIAVKRRKGGEDALWSGACFMLYGALQLVALSRTAAALSTIDPFTEAGMRERTENGVTFYVALVGAMIGLLLGMNLLTFYCRPWNKTLSTVGTNVRADGAQRLRAAVDMREETAFLA